MSKTCYVGVDGKARKVKKIFVGVSGVARKVKKAYIGVGGIARPFFSATEKKLEYYGTVESLSTVTRLLAATSVGKYALFAGGSGNGYSYYVDAYDDTLVRSDAERLGEARNSIAATSVGDYALFVGGYVEVSKTDYPDDAYSSNLVHTYLSGRSTDYGLGATTVGSYALFGGGHARRGQDYRSNVIAYDANLVLSTPAELTEARYDHAATTVGNYALFGGGRGTGGVSSTVDAYDTNLVLSTPAELSEKRPYLATTTVGIYALFVGGRSYVSGTGYVYYGTVDAYTESLVRITSTQLSVRRAVLAATTVGSFAVFAGGTTNASGRTAKSDAVDVYDTSLVRTMGEALLYPRSELAAASVGNYALFGGGTSEIGAVATVDAYVVLQK